MLNNDDSENTNRNVRMKAEPKILDGTYFTIKLREGDKVKAICVFCGAVRSGSVKGTGNFTKHFNDKHPERVGELYNYIKSKSTIVQKPSKQMKLTTISSEQVNSKNTIKKYVLY